MDFNNLPNAIIVSSQRGVRLLREQFAARNEYISVVPDCVHADVFHPNVIDAAERHTLKAQWGIPSERKLEKWSGDSVAGSVFGHQVKPDGWDSEGSPSWLLALGFI